MIATVASAASHSTTALNVARGFGVVVNWLHVIAIVFLIPFGFDDLDDPCPDGAPFVTSGNIAATTNQLHCGLTCGETGADFDVYSLCSPWELGYSGWLLFAGAVLHFFGTALSACASFPYTGYGTKV